MTTRGPVHFREREASRAIRAAEKAGLRVEKVEVSADGRLSLVTSRGKQEVAPDTTNGPGRMINLPYVHSPLDRHGKQRHYFRKPGVKRMPLPGLPGSAEFNRAYEAALAGETTPRVEVGVSRSKPGSVAAAVATYSPDQK